GPSPSILRQRPQTIGPCRRTSASKAAASRSRTNWPTSSASGSSGRAAFRINPGSERWAIGGSGFPRPSSLHFRPDRRIIPEIEPGCWLREWGVMVRRPPHPARRLADLSPRYGGEVLFRRGRVALRDVLRPHTSPPYLGERSPCRSRHGG